MAGKLFLSPEQARTIADALDRGLVGMHREKVDDLVDRLRYNASLAVEDPTPYFQINLIIRGESR